MNTDHTIIGIELEFMQMSDVLDFLRFSKIEFGSHFFSVIDSSVFLNGIRTNLPERFTYDYFAELLHQSFFCERCVLHLYPSSVNEVDKIDKYEDFLSSSCEMLLLMYDGYYVEIYCKNSVWLQRLIGNAKESPCTTIEIKLINSDKRDSMYV